MAGFLQKISEMVAPPATTTITTTGTTNLPAVPPPASGPVVTRPTPLERRSLVGGLPNATVVYSLAASVFFVMALASVFHGAWFSGFLTFLVALCLLGYALYFLRNN